MAEIGIQLNTESNRIMGIGTMSEHYENPIESATLIALSRATQLIKLYDDAPIDSLVLRFETEGKYIQAIFEERRAAHKHRRRNYQGQSAAELTERGDLFVGSSDIDYERCNGDKELAIAVAEFFALTQAFRFISQHEGVLDKSYILHFDIADDMLYAVFEKQ